MERKIALIGFGEAARAFATGHARDFALSAYDLKTGLEMNAALAEAGVAGAGRPEEALAGVVAALSLVTADQALAAARDYASHLPSGALWLDMNSVAPETKSAAAAAIEGNGGRYVDVAVMAPVHPAGRGVPLLASGPHAGAAAALLQAMGFTQVRVIEGSIGAASAVKMIRSVVVKGIEALTAECMSIQLKAESGAICTLSLSFNNDGPLGTFFRYICDNGTWIARYDDLVTGKEEPVNLSGVAVSNNGIELQDREFIGAIREGREPNSSVAQVLPCYRVLDALEKQLRE